MKIITIYFLFSMLCATNVCAQTPDSSKGSHRFSFRGFTSVGQSTFKSSISSPSRFATPEIRVGIGAAVNLTSWMALSSRFTLGVKAKRESFNTNQYVTVGPPFMILDYVASYRNHYFIEFPLLIQVTWPGQKFGIQGGLNYRFFFPDNDAVDFLTNRGESGLITGAYYNVTDKIRIGGSYTFGQTIVYRTSGDVNSLALDMSVKNQFYHITVEYLIGK